MAITKLTIDDFLKLANTHPVLDVRSPGEFEHAHIPNAISLPLFSDEERKVVGTAYKQESRQKAIKIGLKYFGKKMVKMVEEVEKIQSSIFSLQSENSKTVLVHCWRGGMRSAGVAWLLDLYGFKVYTLIGGYKQYRRWVLAQFEKDYPFVVIGGYTGSGKTEVLRALEKQQQAVIHLEDIACHKGSAFGNLGMPKQPTQEQFENNLGAVLSTVSARPAQCGGLRSPVYLEDESQRIGEINIPTPLYATMRKKPVIFLNIRFEERLNHIVETYGCFEQEKLQQAIIRIQKKLGGLETKTAINHLLENNLHQCFSVLLRYYDKFYTKGLVRRENPEQQVKKIDCTSTLASENAVNILHYCHKTH